MKKLFGIIGDPVAHSLSPVIHNVAFAKLSINAEYKLFPVEAAELDDFIERLRADEITGVNVTIPHKQAVIPLLDELSEEACMIGAVNTIVNNNGKLVGYNTDGEGYLKSLFSEFTLNTTCTNAVLIGAGGAALAIAHALAGTSLASLSIVNRHADLAGNLAARLQMIYPDAHFPTGSFTDIERLCEDADLLINATSLGMKGKAWPSLNFVEKLSSHAIVSDIVYVPKETELLKAATQRGLKIHHGLGMLLHQAVRAFELFTGKKAPTDVMEDALLKALN